MEKERDGKGMGRERDREVGWERFDVPDFLFCSFDQWMKQPVLWHLMESICKANLSKFVDLKTINLYLGSQVLLVVKNVVLVPIKAHLIPNNAHRVHAPTYIQLQIPL